MSSSPAFNDNGWPGQRGATAGTAHFNVVRPHKIHPVYLKSCPTALDHILDLGVEEAVGQCHRETLKRNQLKNRYQTCIGMQPLPTARLSINAI